LLLDFTVQFAACLFTWLNWPQAHEPFDAETVHYIESLNPEKDIELLNHYRLKLGRKSTRIYHVSTMLIKKGVARGLTPREIGKIMCGECYYGIEKILRKVKKVISQPASEEEFMMTLSETMDQYFDEIYYPM
jgi:hypothetical protein